MNENKIKNIDKYKIDRTSEIDKFIRLIDSKDELKINHEIKSFNIVLSGCWGSGKSTFINDVIDKLDKDKYEIIIFNAWDYDYWDQPGESIINYLNSVENKNKFKNLSKAIFKDILKGITKWEKLSKFFKQTSEVYAEVKKVKGHEIIEFKETDKKLVFIVEDLDRCKTSFVIKLLESLKHILNVENIILISLLNWEQLSTSIDNLYGIKNDMSQNNEYYLDKIFDIKWDLPNLSKHDILNNGIKSRKYQQISSSWTVSKVEINLADIVHNFYLDDILSIREINKNIATYNKTLIERIDKKPFIYEIESLIFELIKQKKNLSLEFLDNNFSKIIENAFSNNYQDLSWYIFFYLYFIRYNYNYEIKNEKINNLFEEAKKIYELNFSIKPIINFGNLSEEELYVEYLRKEIISKIRNQTAAKAIQKYKYSKKYPTESLFNKYEEKYEEVEAKNLVNTKVNELKDIFIKIINEILI